MMRHTVHALAGTALASLVLVSPFSASAHADPHAMAALLGPISSIDKTKPMPAATKAAIDAAAADFIGSSLDQAPGLWLAVWDPKKGYYEQAYGSAVIGGATATVADHFYIGSITKTAMATAVLQQVQAGTLKLTDTVKNLDPRLAKKYPSIRQITVTQLLSMTSGIPDYADAAVMIMAKDPQHRFTRDQLIALGMSSGKQKPPGSGGYSTTNYLILGHILRSLIPRSPEALVNGVFRQAGMKQSRLPLTTRPLPDPAAHGYVGVLWASQLGDTNPSLTPTSDVSTWAFEWGKEGGGAWSTIGDLATWGGTCLGNSLLPRPIIAERLRTTKIDAGLYGLGIIRQGDWLAHGGQAIGYETNVACNPKTGAVVATAVNSTYGKVDVDSAIGKAAYPEYLAAVSSP